MDEQEFEEKPLVTNTKNLDDDGNISDSQEEENDDTHGEMQTVVDRKKMAGNKEKQMRIVMLLILNRKHLFKPGEEAGGKLK